MTTPRTTNTTPKTVVKRKTKPKQVKKICLTCSQEKRLKEDFYTSADKILNSDGKIPYCKVCVSELVPDFTDLKKVIDTLRRLDRPFILKEYTDSMSANNPFGEYMRRIAMPQNIKLNFSNSQFNDEQAAEFKAISYEDIQSATKSNPIAKFEVTDELIIKWGTIYTEEEIFQLEEFFQRMKESMNFDPSVHNEVLKLLSKLNLKQNQALDEGDAANFSKLNTQYNKTLQDSKLRPIDRANSGESMGIKSFGQIYEAVERDGFIPKHNIEVTQDIVDGTILHTENYTRRLLNMQVVSEPSESTPKVEDYL